MNYFAHELFLNYILHNQNLVNYRDTLFTDVSKIEDLFVYRFKNSITQTGFSTSLKGYTNLK